MANAPELIITGNLTADPELRFTPGGVAVAKVSIAHNTRVKDGDEWKDGDPTYLTCSVWRDMAENVVETLKKGMRVVVTGRLKQRHWENDQGEKRSAYELEVDDIGPSLRWATADVTKKGGSGGGRRTEVPPDDPWASGSKTRPANAEQSRAASAYDEEPPF